MTTSNDRPVTADDKTRVTPALQQSCSTLDRREEDGFRLPTSEAVRSLDLLLLAMQVMPLPHVGPAALHANWAYLVRLRAQQALLALPEDRTATVRPFPARVAFGSAIRPVDDWLLGTLLANQTHLLALRDEVSSALYCLGCEDASLIAQTVRDVVRACSTYLTEIELGDASGHLGFTCDDADFPA